MYMNIDHVIQALTYTSTVTIKELSELCCLDRKVTADIVYGLFIHLHWLTAYDEHGIMLDINEVKSAKNQYNRFDNEYKWSLKKEQPQVFTELSEEDKDLLGQFINMLGKPDIKSKYDLLVDRNYSGEAILFSNVESFDYPQELNLLQDGIDITHYIKAEYEGKTYRLVPYYIYFNDDNRRYYLVAHRSMHEKDGLQLYRCDSFKNIIVDKDNCKLAFTHTQVLRFVSKYKYQDISELEGVKIIVYNQGTNTISETIRRYGRFATISYDEHKNMILEGQIYGINSFKRYLRSMGSGVKVLEPKELVDQIVESYKTKLERYKYYSGKMDK